jgi:hypothetical protein
MAAATLSDPHVAAVAALLALQRVQASYTELAITGRTLKRLADTFAVSPAQPGSDAMPSVQTQEAA